MNSTGGTPKIKEKTWANAKKWKTPGGGVTVRLTGNPGGQLKKLIPSTLGVQFFSRKAQFEVYKKFNNSRGTGVQFFSRKEQFEVYIFFNFNVFIQQQQNKVDVTTWNHWHTS